MRIKKYILENGFRSLGLVIVLVYGLCYICTRFKLLGISQMDNDSLTIGFLVILVGNHAHYRAQTPDQTINTGVIFLCGMFGMLLITVLNTCFSSAGADSFFIFAGICCGTLFGLLLSKIRPSYADATGLWRGFLHFVLTQMDFEKAFKREKKSTQQSDMPNPRSPPAQGAGVR